MLFAEQKATLLYSISENAITPRGRRPSHAIHRYDIVNLGGPVISTQRDRMFSSDNKVRASNITGSRMTA